MDATSIKRWCFANVIWPGVALIDDNGTREPPPPTCHEPGLTPPGSAFIEFMEEHWLVVLLITLAIIISVGAVLVVHHMRCKALLREQLDAGHIDRDQYERLR